MSEPKHRTEAVEILAGHPQAALLITCEHASQRMPEGWSWPERDRRLIDTHWAYDLGAEELARELGAAMGAPAVLSRFSRLLVDANRPEGSPTLFRQTAEGEPIELNTTHLDDAERQARIETLLRPYHAAIDAEVASHPASVLFAVHTFTPVYEGAARSLEVGVLFDQDERLAEQVAATLARRGLRTELNEPYSGKEGLMYSVDRHARAHARQAIEIEVRQDLAVDALFRKELVPLLQAAFG